MARTEQQNLVPHLAGVALAGWIVPGGGYFLIKEYSRGLMVFLTICLLFLAGIYIGSIGIIDRIGSLPWFVLQMANSPLVELIDMKTAGGAFPVFGRPCEFGEIYTGTAGWLNLLVIVNSVYLAYLKKTKREVPAK